MHDVITLFNQKGVVLYKVHICFLNECEESYAMVIVVDDFESQWRFYVMEVEWYKLKASWDW